jgi:hypothetical protein
MNLTVTGDWHEADNNYRRQYALTNDPRVVAVIEREQDMDRNPIDGDAFAPAAWITYRNGYVWEKAGETFQDDDAMNAYVGALDHFGRGTTDRFGVNVAERFMAAFHGTTVREVEVYRGDVVVILNTPAWRENIGLDDTGLDRARILDGEVDVWRAVRDGEVYGVGYAVLEGRVMDDGAPIDLDGWDVEIGCWGFLGEKYARDSAASFDGGTPELPAMLPLPV